MNVQFKKGILEPCVLSLLSQKDYYGYELVESISKYIEISEGTIYPLLKRLRDQKWVITYLVESPSGPPRKYYQLTKKGQEEAKLQVSEVYNFTKGVMELLQGAKNDD
ncbi:MAG TPA: PadR family transcriptional regulator [Erysipelothrix sp.]|jgi:PadR family transcriptional regulator PadR|nr:PadR family transcriptional regulator [Erysipelothrix sp.]